MTNRALGPPRELSDIQRRTFEPGEARASWELEYTWPKQLTTEPERVEWYRRQYAAGYAAATRGGDSRKWESGMTSFAWDDGFVDGASMRERWHYTHCSDPDECGEH